MKAFIFLLCLTVFGFATEKTFSQEKIMIDQDQLVTVNQVFKIIKRHTDYRFIYPKKIFKNTPKIQLKRGEILVSKLIEYSLSSANISFKISENDIIIKKKLPAFIDDIPQGNQLQEIEVKGIIYDPNGLPMSGVNIIEKNSNNGTTTSFDGKFSIKVANENAFLIISYIGFSEKEVSIKNKTDIRVTLLESADQLDEIIITGGLRSSELKAVRLKREAAFIIEAITPEEIGNFSDDNVVDALQRVPGVQVERDDTGTSGDRVSVRGVGPQFVSVTINGRTPFSAGNEGTADFRQFNLGILPPEVINSVLVYKTPEAGLVESGLGGTVDFQTLRPLNTKYKNERNFFGAVNLRGEVNDALDNEELTPRISVILGGKTKDGKLGAYASVITSESKRSRDFVLMRGSLRDVRVDTNGNGVYNPNVDEVIPDVRTINSVGLNPIREKQKRLGLSSAIQWKPIEGLDIMADVTYVKFDNNSFRDVGRPTFNQGGGQSIYNTNTVWAPGSFILEDGFMKFLDFNGASRSTGRLVIQSIQYDDETDNVVGGLNAEWSNDNWKISADYSISNLDYILNLRSYGTSIANVLDQTEIIYDGTGTVPKFTFGNDALDPANYTYGGNRLNEVQLIADNNAFRLDLNHKIDSNVSIDFGGRYSFTELDSRVATSATTFRPDTDQVAAFIAAGGIGIKDNFIPEENVISQYPTVNKDLFVALNPGFYAQRAGSVFEGDLFDAEDGDFNLDRGRSFAINEKTLAFYSQLNFEDNFGGLPFKGNFGLRAVRTSIKADAYTAVTLLDPLNVLDPVFDEFIEATTTSDRWDVLPNLNLNLELSKRLNYRFSISKVITRPNLEHLIPRNDVNTLNPDSGVLDPNNPEYIENLDERSRGEIIAGNPDLKPYAAWQLDNTIEWYTKWGGAFVLSGFYKKIDDFIFTQTIEAQPYPGNDNLGLNLPSSSQEQLYNITTPINFSDAKLYGFEIGFNQAFTFLPSPLDGLGLRANFTHIESNFVEDVGDVDEGFPGSSENSFTSVLYYDKYGIGVRVAYTQRSDYLRQLGGGADIRANTQFTDGIQQLNIRLSYNIFRNAQISVNGSNILDNVRRDYLGNSSNTWNYITLDRIWTFGFRYGF